SRTLTGLFFFSSRRRHTSSKRDWSSDVCSSDLVALTVLGLGWSACLISASALLAGVSSDEVRVPLQGATDAGMNYAGAAVAALRSEERRVGREGLAQRSVYAGRDGRRHELRADE